MTKAARWFEGAHLEVAGRNGYTIPPLDGSLTYPEMLEFQAKFNPDWVFIKYRKVSSPGKEIVELRFKDFYSAVHRFGRYFARELGIDVDSGSYKAASAGVHGYQSRPVVAIFANGDSLSYHITLAALMRVGVVPFAISINNSREALTHLLKVTDSTAVIRGTTNTNPDVDRTLQGALDDLARDGRTLQTIEWASTELFDGRGPVEFSRPIITIPPVDVQETMVILHSSGSTSFPKPVPSKHAYMSHLGRMTWYGDHNMSGTQVYLGHLPPWHAFAWNLGVISCHGIGWTNILKEPTDPPKPVSPAELLEELDVMRPNMFACVPMLYRTWSRDPNALAILSRIDFCVTGGGPMDPELGKRLAASGVRLKNILGATECMDSQWMNNDTDPNRLELPRRALIFLRPQSNRADNNEYELLIGANDVYEPNVFNDEWQGKPVYATADLIRLEPKISPEDPQYFHIIGRVDDQLMHSTGEKTNPGPLVHILESSELVHCAVYFGRDRPHVGALVEPAPGHSIDPRDEKALARFRSDIWSVVQKANEYAPSHSTLFKEMITVTYADHPLPRTAKGTIRTGAALRDYASEIDAVYDAFEQVGQSNVAVPDEWDIAAVTAFVQDVVRETIDTEAAENADIFALGVSSLNVTRIRNVLSRAIGKQLEPGFVYEHPTPQSLASALLAVKAGERQDTDQSTEAHITAMRQLLEKYAHWKPSVASNGSTPKSAKESDAVLVTGTTGGLGAHLLDVLVRDPTVSRVFAVNRPSTSASLLQRQRAALTSRGLDPAIAESAKVQLIEADLAAPQMGLTSDLLDRLRSEVTVVVHNSWQLNFNLSLASFEPHIAGTRALIDLALECTHDAAILFTSSIAAVSGPLPTDGATMEEDYDLSLSVGGGYGESKAVAEHLLWRASVERGLRVANIRIGQLCGSTTNGAWAPTDWVPAMIQSARELRCLPSLSSATISWLPTDVAAQSLLELRRAISSRHIFHIVHPRVSLWDEALGAIAKELGVELVPYNEWLDRLQESSAPAEKLPALKLREFFSGAATRMKQLDIPQDDDNTEAMGLRRLDTTQSQQYSRTLNSLQPLQVEAEVAKWVAYWRSIGFLR